MPGANDWKDPARGLTPGRTGPTAKALASYPDLQGFPVGINHEQRHRVQLRSMYRPHRIWS